VHEALTTYRFDVAADRLYHFFWHEYADWYIEMVKQHLQAEGTERDTARAVLLEVHDRVLRLLHPIIPFVTEELWQPLPRRAGDGQTITLAAYPAVRGDWVDEAVVSDVELLQGVVTTIRTARAERTVRPSERVSATIEGADASQRRALGDLDGYVKVLAGLNALAVTDAAPSASSGTEIVTRVYNNLRVHIQMPQADRGAELEKLQKKLSDLEREIGNIEGKLANDAFVSRAPAKVVEDSRTRRESLLVQKEKLLDTLRELGA
jgi:valyl-tRNA synthetase